MCFSCFNGSQRQSLRLFLDRIRYDLSYLRHRPQMVLEVPPRRDAVDEGPTSGVDWLRRIGEEVNRKLGVTDKPPADTIVEAAHRDDLLVVLGPLRLETLIQNRDIKKGLFQFVEEELADLMSQHAQAASKAKLGCASSCTFGHRSRTSRRSIS